MNWKSNFALSATYLVCFISIAAYLCVLFAPLDVCIEYKLYYIDKALVEWPGYGGLHCEFGDEISMSASPNDKTDRHAGHGWSNREAGFRWSEGEQAHLYFTTPYKDKMLIAIKMGELLCTGFDLYINDERAGCSADVKNGILLCEFLGESAYEDNLFDVRFDIHNPIRPCDVSDSTDTRELGIPLISFMLLENTLENRLNCYEVYDLLSNDRLECNIGDTIYLGRNLAAPGQDPCGNGWSGSENDFRWTDGKMAYAYFRFADEIPQKIMIEVGNTLCASYDIAINGCVLIEGCNVKNSTVELTGFAEAIVNHSARLEISINDPQRPCDISDSTDARWLGLQVVSIRFADY